MKKVYEGERNEAGERHGEGRATLPGGHTYQGQYDCGLRHGRGEYQMARSGARYCGEWQRGHRHGLGVCVFEDGSHYQGEFEFKYFRHQVQHDANPIEKK